MIKLFFKNDSDQRTTKYLASYHTKLFEQTVATQREIMAELMERIRENLSGEVLDMRTKRLVESVKLEVVKTVGNRVIGQLSVGEGLGIYPLVQEYGGKKHYEIVPRTKQALAFLPKNSKGSKLSFSGKVRSELYFRKERYKRGRLKPTSFGKFEKLGGIVVKRVERDPLPERSYVRTALAEMQARMTEKIRVTIQRTLT